MEIEAREGGVRVVRLGDGLNQFDATFIAELGEALDAVEADGDATAMVTTASGKHYSNGFDLQFLGSLELDGLKDFLDRTSRTLARILVSPIPTVAAMNGHAFGIGALLALAHDQRVQNAERGWFCLPEVDLGMRFNRFQLALVVGKLSRPTANEAILSGARWDGAAALDGGIVQATVGPEDLVRVATEVCAPRVGKGRDIVRTLKGDLYAGMLETLDAGGLPG